MLPPHGSVSFFKDLFSLEMNDANCILLYLPSGMLNSFNSLPTQMCFLVVQRELKHSDSLPYGRGHHSRNSEGKTNRILSTQSQYLPFYPDTDGG